MAGPSPFNLAESEERELGAVPEDAEPAPTPENAPATPSREPGTPRNGLTAEEIEFRREDTILRRDAPIAYPVSSKVVSAEQGHPTVPTFCENCSAVGSVLSWCGVRLCFPCWRKQGGRSMMEVARVLSVVVKRRRESGLRPGLRFVTLTRASARSLRKAVSAVLEDAARLFRSRTWRGWVEGKTLKVEVTWNPETAEWHAHLHLVVVGRFIPHDWTKARHVAGCPRRSREDPAFDPLDCDHATEPGWECYACAKARVRCEAACEANLKDEWLRSTRGRGSVVDVREVDTRDPLAFAKELAKYLVKPSAETGEGSAISLADWPEDVRLELARWLTGGTRTVWRCGPHRSMSRRLCLSLPETRWGCEGRYRKEWVGARRLRWSGVLRAIHRETEATREALDLEAGCATCGKGPVLSAWEVRRRLALGWSLPDGIDPAIFDRPRLPFIQAHKSTGARSARGSECARMRIDVELCTGPTDGSGPPGVRV